MKAKVLFLALFFGLICPSAASGQFSLWLVEKRIDIKYSVPNITHQELSEKLNSKEAVRYVLFDVRERAEYDASHLASALHVDPEMKPDAFFDTFGSMIQGKNLIFYCSVGDRSSHFIERVQKQAKEKEALGLYNLRGGIFRWYNEGHPVVDKKGETNAIHPYDDEWGKLVRKRDRK
ncbi:MAG: rhodanese-like domain-containing protein [Deltaproteobacteria bacterium]|nr:rhodanese-like domain-containing protein [Deltaproteobacteria bacterium]